MKKLIAILILAAGAHAQQKLDYAVKFVNDRRTNGSFAQLHITLEVANLKSSEVAGTRVVIARATDDLGNDLVDHEAAPMMEMNPRLYTKETNGPATISLALKNPGRKAKTVKEVSGEVELFLPSKDPNSIAEVTGFMPQSGKPLAHKALKANGVEITVLTPKQIEAEKKKRMDAKRKEYADAGYDEETIKSSVESEFESFASDESEVLAIVKDPNQRIQDVAYIDGDGKTQMVNMRIEDGIARLMSWSGRPQANWKMRVTMQTPKNLVRHPFTIANVALP
jgi:hypothetical protein